MHCLSQRLKSTLFEIFSNGGCPKGTRSEKKFQTFALTSYARNSQKKQYLIFEEMRMIFSFAYLSAVWLLLGKNPIETIEDKFFLLDFALIVTKQLIHKQN
jgi:hypothetical protein